MPQSFSENIRFAAGNTGGFHNAAPKVQPIPYADRTLRPLALLLDRTLRPLEVAILFIKPCSLLRCLVLGLKVVFMACCTSFNQNHTLRGEKNSRTRRKNRHKILEHYFRLYEIPNFSSSFFHKFPQKIFLFQLIQRQLKTFSEVFQKILYFREPHLMNLAFNTAACLPKFRVSALDLFQALQPRADLIRRLDQPNTARSVSHIPGAARPESSAAVSHWQYARSLYKRL